MKTVLNLKSGFVNFGVFVLGLGLAGGFSGIAYCQNTAPSTSSGTFVTFDVPGETDLLVLGINDSGAVAGFYSLGSLHEHGFLRGSDGTLTIFDAPGATRTFATSINKSGEIAGTYVDGSGVVRGFLRDPKGTITPFDIPPNAPNCGVVLNDSGEVAGCEFVLSGPGFVRDARGVLTVINPGCTFVAAGGINKSGEIAGSCDNGAYLRDAKSNLTQFTVPGAIGTGPQGINDAGEIAGAYLDAQFEFHGFLRDLTGAIHPFDVPGADRGTSPAGINKFGDVVGMYCDASFMCHGFLRDPSGAITSFDVPGAACGTGARAINGSRTIAGVYYDATCTKHGFLWNP